ncbi:hypothetical protein [Limnoglobus roseus]|uniref:Uncharacterized protein n=1 Tax=Limnoglobus roseus TaxID=2598579 RepID=A0A5C1AP45_9BACT|nr:hypothetical protein [Limnoglobus roseus]QEL19927.1 hypothetical protein PX52LOC_07009 [Limnoglobus roseus]
MALLLAAALVAVVIGVAMDSRHHQCSGFSFAHPGGDCVVWYARDGDRIFDLVIAPRSTFASCYQAAHLRLMAGDTEVAFGSTHRAYICEGGAWRTVPLGELRESAFPPVTVLERCGSTAEVARQILAR